MGEISSRLRAQALNWAGGVVLVAGAWPLISFHASATIIDRLLPLIVLIIWVLAARTPEGLTRDLIRLLVPLLFAVSLSVADQQLRMLLDALVLSAGVVMHVRMLPAVWESSETITALVTVLPLRIVEPLTRGGILQAFYVTGLVLLWREMRRGGTGPVTTAGAVVLLGVTLPGISVGGSLAPWVIATVVHVYHRESGVAKLLAVAASLLVARWLAAASLLILGAEWASRRWRPASWLAVFAPQPSTFTGNLGRMALPLSFFPSLFSSVERVIPLLATGVLAMAVRPSLTAPVMVTGIVVACSIRKAPRESTKEPVLEFSGLVLVGMIVAFFPWSGAVIARPPAPLAAVPVLAIAAIALLPATFRGWSGVAGCLLAAAVVVAIPEPMAGRSVVGRSLTAGESFSMRLPDKPDSIEVQIAGANLADARHGRPIARVVIIDALGRAHAKDVTIGETADWGAFRPELVLSSWNPRPDRPSRIEGFGIEAWIRGTGRIRIGDVEKPRWLIVGASSALREDEQVIVEEVEYE